MFWMTLLCQAATWLFGAESYCVHQYPPVPVEYVAPVQCLPVPPVQPFDVMVYHPMPCGPMPCGAGMPATKEKLYRVEVCFPQAKKSLPGMCVQMLVREGRIGTMEPIQHASEGKVSYRTLAVSVKPLEKGQVEVQMEMLPVPGKGNTGEWSYAGKKAVTLGICSEMMLTGNGPEPCCVKVQVRESGQELPAPTPIAQVGCSPSPVATSPVSAWCPPAVPPPPVAACAGNMSARCTAVMPMPAALPLPTECVPMPAPIALANATVPATGMQRVESSRFSQTPLRSTRLVLVRENGKSRLETKMDNARVTMVRMKREMREIGPITLAAGKKYIHVTGKQWKATAEQVELREDGQIILSGQVKLMADKNGLSARIQAGELCLRPGKGSFEIVSK